MSRKSLALLALLLVTALGAAGCGARDAVPKAPGEADLVGGQTGQGTLVGNQAALESKSGDAGKADGVQRGAARRTE